MYVVGKAKWFITMCLFVCVAVFPVLSFANTPIKVTYKGQLSESGAQVNGPKLMTFKIYDDFTVGTELWSSGEQTVEVNNGSFNYILGNNVPLDNIDLEANTCYLEITIKDGETPIVLTPREEIKSVFYALNADKLDGFDSSDFLDPINFTAPINEGNISDYAVTSDKISDSAITSAKIDNDAVGSDQISSTSVTAGNYTNANISVDEDGRITTASNGSAINFTQVNDTIQSDQNIALQSDTSKLSLGADADLEIYHDGSNGYVDSKTGNLLLNSSANGGVSLFSNSVAGDSELLKIYGWNTAATANKWFSLGVLSSDDYIHLGREDANILGLKVDMDLISAGILQGSNFKTIDKATIIGIGATGATGSTTYSTALGYLAKATGAFAVSIGYYSTAVGGYPVAVGYNAKADASWSPIAIGSSATSKGTGAVSIGYYSGSYTNADYQISIGYYAGNQVPQLKTNVISIGNYAGYKTTANSTIAIGKYTGYLNSGEELCAIGTSAGNRNSGDNVIAIGYQACYDNIGDNVIAIGYQSGINNTLANQFIVKQANINATPLIQGDFSTGLVNIAGGIFTDNVAIGTTTPTAKLDVEAAQGYDQLRLRTAYTPTGTADANGNTGDIAWDDDYVYVKTAAGWKRSTLSTF